MVLKAGKFKIRRSHLVRSFLLAGTLQSPKAVQSKLARESVLS